MFKKLILGITLVSAMVACTDDYTDWSAPQQNPQPEIATFGNGSVAAVKLIDFATLDETLDSVQVCTIQAPTSSDAAYASPYYLLHLGESVYEIGASGKMAVADLKYFVESTFGKAPYERTMEATLEQWISNGATSVKTATSEPFAIKAKLLAPELYPNLYLIGAPSEWNPTCTTMPFAHSDMNVYDDPVFTITFPVADGDCWFAFADDKTVETGDWSNVFGALEGNGLNLVGETGHFDRRSALSDDGSFKVTVAGDAKYVKFTVMSSIPPISSRKSVTANTSISLVLPTVGARQPRNFSRLPTTAFTPALYTVLTPMDGATSSSSRPFRVLGMVKSTADTSQPSTMPL